MAGSVQDSRYGRPVSNRLLEEAWDHSPSEDARLLVLLRLAHQADEEGLCWPSIQHLAEKTRLSVRHVERALKELAADGEVEVPTGPRNEQNPYRVVGGYPTFETPECRVGPDAGVGSPCIDENEKKRTGVGAVWNYYQEKIPGASRQKLDSTKTTIIRNALKVRDEETCCRAINGLAVSPFHNGENDRHTKYLGIRYALKGNQRDGESNDERIDKMVAKAAQTPGDFHATFPTEVKDRMRKVEMMLLRPEDSNLRARAGNARAELLKRYGLRATLVEGTAPTGFFFGNVGGVPRYVSWVRTSTASSGSGV